MKQFLVISATLTALLTSPLHAEDPPAGSAEIEEGFSLLREGSRLLFEQLFDELAPALEELEGFVLDLNAYEAPEILPNGDIIIRRKPDAPEFVPPVPDAPDAGSEDEIIDL